MFAWCAVALAASDPTDDELPDLLPAPTVERTPEERAAIERLAVIDRFRDEALYVVGAWVVKRTRTTEPLTYGTPPNVPVTRRWFAVAYGARPAWERTVDLRTIRTTRIVSEEWVVCDGRGRLLDEVTFADRVGEPGGKPRRGGVVLDGVQIAWDRASAENLAARVTEAAAASAGVDPTEQESVRALVLASLPEPEWTERRPRPIRPAE